MDAKLKIGQMLQTVRKKAGLSQKVLAAKSGVSFRTIQDIEKGRGNPALDTVQALADTLKIDPLDFFQQDGKRNYASLSFSVEILQRILNLSPSQKNVVLGLIFEDQSYLDKLPRHVVEAFGILLKNH